MGLTDEPTELHDEDEAKRKGCLMLLGLAVICMFVWAGVWAVVL